MLSALLLFARGAVVLAFALLAVRWLRRSSASLRTLVLATALAAVLVLPLVEGLLPTWHTGTLAVEASPAIVPDLPIVEVGGVAMTSAPVALPPAEREVPWRSILAGLWIAVASLALLRVGIGALGARAIARRGSPARAEAHVDGAWSALAGRGAAPRVVVSAEIEAPIVVGAIAPIVVVPRSSADWTAERWRVVLLHELAHVDQRDGLFNLIAQLACCLHWVNPLVWIAARRLREERELAADDAVLRTGARASSFAEHLLAIATRLPHRTPISVLAMATRSNLESRVAALLDADRPRRAAGSRRAVLATLVSLVAVGTACISPEHAPADIAPRPSPTQIDPTLQSFVEGELERALASHRGTGAIAIVLDAKSGAPLVIASRGGADPRVARTPGSTIKPFTFAAALEAGTVQVTSRLDCDPRRLDLGGILAVSSNTCTAKIAEPLGDQLGHSLRRYRLTAPATIDTRSVEGASIANGEGMRVSALDVAAAYTAFADDGIYHAPNGDGVRVMREDTARAVRGMLERVVVDADGTGHAARIEGVRVAGKTGTTRSRPGSDAYYASFVGIAPVDAPRFIVLVGIDGVAKSGGTVAAPVFATIASRALGR